MVKVIRGGSASAKRFAKNGSGGYTETEDPDSDQPDKPVPDNGAFNAGVTNIQPAAAQTATAGPRNLLGKVN